MNQRLRRSPPDVVYTPIDVTSKLERYHRTAKAKVNVFVHHSLEELVAAMEGFVRYYNYERYHEALGNITPADMYHGRQDAILATRQEVKQKSLAERRLANLRTA